MWLVAAMLDTVDTNIPLWQKVLLGSYDKKKNASRFLSPTSGLNPLYFDKNFEKDYITQGMFPRFESIQSKNVLEGASGRRRAVSRVERKRFGFGAITWHDAVAET